MGIRKKLTKSGLYVPRFGEKKLFYVRVGTDCHKTAWHDISFQGKILKCLVQYFVISKY